MEAQRRGGQRPKLCFLSACLVASRKAHLFCRLSLLISKLSFSGVPVWAKDQWLFRSPSGWQHKVGATEPFSLMEWTATGLSVSPVWGQSLSGYSGSIVWASLISLLCNIYSFYQCCSSRAEVLNLWGHDPSWESHMRYLAYQMFTIQFIAVANHSYEVAAK